MKILRHNDWLNLGEATRVVGMSYGVVRNSVIVGLSRGWYRTREGATGRNPATGGPVTEYLAVPPGQEIQ